MSVVLVVDGELRPHLARALAEHRRWLRANRVPAPVALDALLDALAAPKVEPTPVVPDASAVVCVDCGRETDRPRRGLCNRCRMRRARAQAS